MKILLVRHGETDFNKNKLIQGHSDIVLNKTGKEQAIDAGQKITDFNIDAAFSSPLKRALETAQLMLENSNNSQIATLSIPPCTSNNKKVKSTPLLSFLLNIIIYLLLTNRFRNSLNRKT